MFEPVSDFFNQLSEERILCLMPIERINLDDQIEGPNETIFYPSDTIDFQTLRVVSEPDQVLADFKYRQYSRDMGDFTSAISGINKASLKSLPIVAKVVDLNWTSFLSMTSAEHISLLKRLTNDFEDAMDIVRYNGARLDLPDTLPGRAGLVSTSDGFSATLLYNISDNESYIVTGRYLVTSVISGIGLELENWEPYPILNYGETGNIVRRSLSLYSRALEGSDNTIKFIQIMSLLEFLVMPGEYKGSKAVGQTVALHVANTKKEYHQLRHRLRILSSARSIEDDRQIGYRTLVIHCGKNIENILLPGDDLVALFQELDKYIHIIIDFLISKANEPWSKIMEWRNSRKRLLGL